MFLASRYFTEIGSRIPLPIAKCHLSQLIIQKYRTIFTDYFLILQQVEELMDERKQLEEACAKLKRYVFSR